MHDLFSGAPVNGKHYDLFSGAPIDTFRWLVAVFSQDGAVRAIIKANKADLKTYYPIRFNGKGEPTPLFRSYLFIEFREYVTIELCREVPKFIKILFERDEGGLVQSIKVRRNAIDENKAMVMAGRFNERIINRRFYGKGSIVRVLEGNFIDKNVRLEIDILPEMRGNYRVPVDINGMKAKIEIYKLAL
jgi:hypothetical protein